MNLGEDTVQSMTPTFPHETNNWNTSALKNKEHDFPRKKQEENLEH